MNDSSANRSSKQPSELQMDSLLRDFFALETPSLLKQPFQRPTMSHEHLSHEHTSRVAISPAASASVSVVAVEEPTAARSPRNHRLIVASAISVLAMSLMLAMSVQEGQSSSSSTSAVSVAVPLPDSKSSEETMNVSSEGDQPSSSAAVSEDGTTQEELDAIRVSPLK